MPSATLDMPPEKVIPQVNEDLQAHWAVRGMLLWEHRRLIARVTAISFVMSLCLAFLIPKRYTAATRIMPPDQQGSGAMLLAALARGGGLGALSSLAGGLLGGHSSSALFVDLLHSGTISDHLIQRFDLKRVYSTRYNIDTAKKLAKRTAISDDKKSGVITIKVEDTDQARARDIAQGYLDELNKLVLETNTSAAHQERLFIEQRLHGVTEDLEKAQLALSEFSSKNSAIDLKEQTRAMVDAGAKLQGELLVQQSGLESLRQIYGDGNVRVRQTEARIGSLRSELEKLTGSSAPLSSSAALPGHETGDSNNGLYPPLRQLPRLAVPYADLYRSVRVQETVYELLTQQYEMARIEEAKDVPVVSVIDSPGIPEKKSFPPRLLLAVSITFFSSAVVSALIILREVWSRVDPSDPRKRLASAVIPVVASRIRSLLLHERGVA